jgi:hypothetical protein
MSLFHLLASSLVGRRIARHPAFLTTSSTAAVPAPNGTRRNEAWSVGSGPAVLLVHDALGGPEDMAPLAIALAHHGYRAIGLAGEVGDDRESCLGVLARMTDAVLDVAHAEAPLAGIVAHGVGATAVLLALSREHFTHDAVLIGADAHELSPEAASDLDDVRSLLIHSRDDDVASLHGALAFAHAWPKSMLARVDGLGHERILFAESTLDSMLRFFDTRDLEPHVHH